MRADEPGERLVVRGRVLSTDGTPLAGAVVDHWQAGADGWYSYFCPPDADGKPLTPDGNLRARFETNDAGRVRDPHGGAGAVHDPQRRPYRSAARRRRWHPWRPAHLHYFVDAEGHDRLTTQLFFTGDRWLGTDVAGADKPALILAPTPARNGGLEVTYDFTLQPGEARRLGHSAQH